MKVVFVQNDLPPDHFGGSEVYTLKLAKCFVKRGIDVVILTRRLPNHISYRMINGVKIKRIGIEYRNTSIVYRFLWLITFITFGCIECSKIQPDIIHSHTRVPGGIISGIIGYITKGTSFWSIHSNLDSLNRFEKFIAKMILMMNQKTVVASKFTKKQVLRFKKNPKDIYVIPNGIDFIPTINPIKRRILNNNILFIGRLHPVKGLTTAINAFRILKDRGIKFNFLIVGTGVELMKLKNLVEELQLREEVSFLGKVSDEMKHRILSSSSYFLLPSLSECFPITILEALREKLYIIATKVGGVPEMLEYGKYGSLFSKGNEEALANVLSQILKENDSKILKKTESAFKYAEKKYNLDAVAKSHIIIYSININKYWY